MKSKDMDNLFKSLYFMHRKYGSKVFFLLFVAFMSTSCEEEEMKVPVASTQAAFEFEVVFVNNDQTGELNYQVTFQNQSINAEGYLWDFGNGDTSSEDNPVYVYTADGVYDVTLEAIPGQDQQGLHYNNLTAENRISLVPTLFEEKFDDPGLENNFPPEGWFLLDEDGDGQPWYWDAFEGEFYILSRSWDADLGALTPDNWIITPQIDLTEVTSSMKLEWDITPTANTPQYRAENYSVLVSVSGTEPDDFQEVFTERLTSEMENWVWITRNIDMSGFAGEQIYIAFRHHDSTDNDRIALTNIHLFQSGK